MNKQSAHNAADSSDLGLLVELLGPLNNRWRDAKPPEKVLTLWEMGNVILTLVPHPTDSLLWQIQERSYITRNVLRYALIVRRSWEDKSKLEEMARGLCSYTVFREALPFLKGDREGIDNATYNHVVSLLRSPDTVKAIKFLKELKAQKIGRKHKKGTGVAAIRDQAAKFEQSLARLESQARSNSAFKANVPDDLLVTLSQMAMTVATGEISANSAATLPIADDDLLGLADTLSAAVRGGRASAAALRKAVGTERLMQAADLLNSLRNENALAEWRNRSNIRLSLGSSANTSGANV